jgi:hypothetical protein
MHHHRCQECVKGGEPWWANRFKVPVSPGCCVQKSIWHKMADLVYRQILPLYASARFHRRRMAGDEGGPEGGLWDDQPTAGTGRTISVSCAEGNLLLSVAGCVLLRFGNCSGRSRPPLSLAVPALDVRTALLRRRRFPSHVHCRDCREFLRRNGQPMDVAAECSTAGRNLIHEHCQADGRNNR